MQLLGCVYVLLVLGVVVAYVLAVTIRDRAALEAKLVRRAHDDYRAVLRDLAADPVNPALEQRALNLGRAYAALTRDQTAEPLYDAIDLWNDICAATSAATARTA